MTQRSLTCREAIDFLIDYVQGEMPPKQAEVFEEHLDRCPPCQAYLETYREAVRMGKEVCKEDRQPIDPHLAQAILDAIRKS
ncbi:MAG TPA: zf-HC2 domain-containing protein [Acidobacteriota bacterium]|nr:zf-HC2 domain-containing protein [Acidobacteriota bacterium]